MRRDNSYHLVAAAQRRSADTLERARRALHELGETGEQHTSPRSRPMLASPAHGSTPSPNSATNSVD